jgi:hypothetical protein
MENNVVRKVWQTPQVFVLGAESTQAYLLGGTNEEAHHLPSIYKHNSGTNISNFTLLAKGTVATYTGWES